MHFLSSCDHNKLVGNIPGKTLVLIAVLVTLTIVLLGIAMKLGGSTPLKRRLVTLTPTPSIEKTAIISFFPANLDLTLVTTPSATVDIITTTGKNPITGAQVEISYDPKVITNVSVLPPDTATSLFGSQGSYTNLFADLKTPGKISFALAINPGGNPVLGAGSIGKISFSTTKGTSPTATMTFGKGTVVTSKTTQDSVLSATTSLAIKLK